MQDDQDGENQATKGDDDDDPLDSNDDDDTDDEEDGISDIVICQFDRVCFGVHSQYTCSRVQVCIDSLTVLIS